MQHPLPAQQRLIHCGKVCSDDATIGSVLSKHGPIEAVHPFHLVLSGASSALTRTRSLPAPPRPGPSRPAPPAAGAEVPLPPVTAAPQLARAATSPVAAASWASALPPAALRPASASPQQASLPTSPEDKARARAEARAAALAAAEARAARDPAAETPAPLLLARAPASAPAALSQRRVSFSDGAPSSLGASPPPLAASPLGAAPPGGASPFRLNAVPPFELRAAEDSLAAPADAAYALAYAAALQASPAAAQWHQHQHHQWATVAAWNAMCSLAATAVQQAAWDAWARQQSLEAYRAAGFAASPAAAAAAHAAMACHPLGGGPAGAAPHSALPHPSWELVRAGAWGEGLHHSHQPLVHPAGNASRAPPALAPLGAPGAAAVAGGGGAAAAAAAIPAVVPAVPEAAPFGARVFFWLVTGDDLKLLLKLAAAVLLLGQGDSKRQFGLAGAALGCFVVQVVAGFRARNAAAQLAADRQRRGNAGSNAGAAGAGAAGSLDGAGLEVELPPLVPRGLLEGGIVEGGGYSVDLAYLLFSAACSLYPGWQPLPALDPLEVDRRRRIDERRDQLAAERRRDEGGVGGGVEDEVASDDDDDDDDDEWSREQGQEERAVGGAYHPMAAGGGRPHQD